MKKLILNLGLFAALTGALNAGELITYQGRLKESGIPVSDNRTFDFHFCATEGGAGCVPSADNPQDFQVLNGLFKSTFTAPAVDFANGPWYLRVSVEGTPLLPLERLTAVPYAVYAASAAYAAALSVSSGEGVYSSTNVLVSGVFTVSDFSVMASTESMAAVSTLLKDKNPAAADIRVALTAYAVSDSPDADDILAAGNFEAEVPAGKAGMMVGLRAVNRNDGSSAKATGLLIDSLKNTGAIGETYGILISTLTGGTQASRPYALYSEDRNAASYFAGPVGISSLPAYALAVSSGTGDIFWVAHDAVHAVKFVGDGSGLTGVTGAAGTDSSKVLKAGDTMIGQLTITGSTLTVLGPSGAGNPGLLWVSTSASAPGLLVSTQGFVGINTAAPQYPLHIISNQGGQVAMQIDGYDSSHDSLRIDSKSTGSPGVVYMKGGTLAAITEADSAGLHIAVGPMADEKVTITPDTKVGVGTTSPAYRLHVSSGAGEAGDLLVLTTGTANVVRLTGDGRVYANRYYGDGSGLTGVTADLTSPSGTLDIGDGGTSATTAADARTNLGAVNVAGDTMTGPLAFSLNNAVFSNSLNTGGIIVSTGGAITTTGPGTGSVSGNARGQGAIDLQTARGAAAQVASGNFSVIGGGMANSAVQSYATVGGGSGNYAGGDNATVSGGYNNGALGYASAVGGGAANSATGILAVISGGDNNSAQGYYAAINGGAYNLVTGSNSVVSGGRYNVLGGTSSVIAGGEYNSVTGMFSAVAGGTGNSAYSDYAAVGGGKANSAAGIYSAAAGGNYNSASGQMSAVGGGNNNSASGGYSAIPGGDTNQAMGLRSLAAGFKAQSTNDGTFTWADSEGTMVLNSVNDRTRFKSRGGFLVSGSTDAVLTGQLNRGLLVTGNGLVGVSTGSPQAALDVVSDNSAVSQPAQIWRDSSGNIVSSMSSAGHMMAARYVGDGSGLTGLTGDGLGGHTATQNLDMAGLRIINVGTITVSGENVVLSPYAREGNYNYAISIGSGAGLNFMSGIGIGYGAFNNYGYGVGVGRSADTNYNYGVGLGYMAHSNSNNGVGVGNAANTNNTGGVGVGTNASGNSNYGTGLGASSSNNSNYGVGVGAYSQNNYDYGTGVGAYTSARSSSAALGYSAKAPNQEALALGAGSKANAFQSAAIGAYTVNDATATVKIWNNGITISTGGAIQTTGVGYGTTAGNPRGQGATDLQTMRAAATEVASGSLSVIGGGGWNTASGAYSAVPGGSYNQAAGNYSFAAGYAARSTAQNTFTWADSGGNFTDNTVQDRAIFKAKGGFLVTGSTNTVIGATADRGVILVNGTIGVSTGVPYAALDVVSTGTASNVYAQIWRDSSGVVVASITSQGVLGVSGLATGDNLGNHNAAQNLQMNWFNIHTVSTITAAGHITASAYQINGSTVVSLLPGTNSFSVGPDAGRINSVNNNLFVGSQAGYNNITSPYNLFLGYRAGYANTTGGGYNMFLGYEAGRDNTSGVSNTFVGFSAGVANQTGNYNVFLGPTAGGSNLSGSSNSFLGFNAGNSNTTGALNSVVGYFAGLNTKTGSANSIFGTEAGKGVSNNSFSSSTLVGYRAGYGLTTGSDNIFLGYQAGYSVTTGTGNIVIGANQDVPAPNSNNALNIGGVLFGDLSQRIVGISTRAPQAALDVVSTGTAANVYAQIWRDSDGTVVASVTAQGRFSGDGSGLSGISASDPLKVAKTGDTMTGQLTLAGSTLTVTGGGFSVGGSTLVVMGDKVGIGRAVPTYLLTLQSQVATNTPILAVYDDDGDRISFLGKGVDDEAVLDLADGGGSSKIYLNAKGDSYLNGGRVGIDTTTPAEAFDIAGRVMISTYAGGNSSTDGLFSYGTNGMRYDSNGATYMRVAYNATNLGLGGPTVFTGASYPRVQVQGDMSIGSSFAAFDAPADGLAVQGKVGIGTATPTALLDVRDQSAIHGFVLRVGTGTAADSASLVVTTGGIVGVGTLFPSTQTVFHAHAMAGDKTPGVEDVTAGVMGSVRAFGTGSEDAVTGGDFESSADGSQNVAYLVGVHTSVERTSGGTGYVGKAIGLYVDEMRNSSAGTGKITDTYGVFIATMATDNQTNAPYAVYSVDPNARSYFAGRVGISSATPSHALVISSAPGSSDVMLLVSTGSSVVFGVKGNGEVYTSGRFIGDGSSLTGITAPGDSLGTHVATKTLDMAGFNITNAAKLGVGAAVDPSYIANIYQSNAGAVANLLQLSNESAAGTGMRINFNAAGVSLGAITVRDVDAAGTATMQFDQYGVGEVMRLQRGNLGLGTNSPAAKFEVTGGTVVIHGRAEDAFVLKAGDNGVNISTGGTIQTAGAGHGFVTGNARGMGAVDLQTSRTAASQVASGLYSVIAGGRDNTASGNYSFVVGNMNSASAYGAAVGGGFNNTATNNDSTVAGGLENDAAGFAAAVGGGRANEASGDSSFVGGGGLDGSGAVGGPNKAQGRFTAVAGGTFNVVSGSNSVIAGGAYNTVTGTSSVVAGGENNRAQNFHATVGGGFGNTAGAPGSVVSGGRGNSAQGESSSVSGGDNNIAANKYAFVGGGDNNVVNNWNAAIVGGSNNRANGMSSFIGGGGLNLAGGWGAAVFGSDNAAMGQYSFAAGYKSTAAADGTFSWADSEGTGVVNSLSDQVMFKARGGFWVSTGSVYATPALYVNPNNNLVVGATGGGGISRLTVSETNPKSLTGNQYVLSLGTGTIPAMLTVSTSGAVSVSGDLNARVWQRIFYTELGSSLGGFGIPNLRGNKDEEYKLILRVVEGVMGVCNVNLIINGDAVAANYRSQYYGANVGGAPNYVINPYGTAPNIPLGTLGTGGLMDEGALIEGTLYAKAGYEPRLYSGTSTSMTSTTTRQVGGGWKGAGAEITSLTIATDLANCLGAGTIIELWAFR